MTAVKFGTEEKVAITQKLQRYLADELALEIGQFDAEFFWTLYPRNWAVISTTVDCTMLKRF